MDGENEPQHHREAQLSVVEAQELWSLPGSSTH